MCRYQFFRDTFARFVIEASGQDPTSAKSALSEFIFQFAHVETQSYSEVSGTYPDVVIDTDELRIVIEMKTNTWTGFQDSQPGTYLKDLGDCDAPYKGLIVIIPKYHSHEKSIKDQIVKHRKASGKRPFILLLYWEDFIRRLEDAGARELNSIFKDYLDLSNDWFINGRITLNQGQIRTLQKSMGTALFSLRALVEVIYTRFRRSDGIRLGRLKMTDYDFGFFISNPDRQIGYFGIANYAWISGSSPILIGVHQDYLENLDTNGLLPAEDEDGLRYWGLSRSLLAKTTVIDEIAKMVEKTFKVKQIDTGENEGHTQFDEAMLDLLFDTKDAPSAFQSLIKALEQVGVAVAGNATKATVKTPVSRWEHSLYFAVGGDEIAGIGIFFGDWKDKGSPLWVGVPERKQDKFMGPEKKGWISKKGEYRESESDGYGPWKYRAINLDRISADDNLVEFLLKTLQLLGLDTQQEI
jgi:hypothetical protein